MRVERRDLVDSIVANGFRFGNLVLIINVMAQSVDALLSLGVGTLSALSMLLRSSHSASRDRN